MAKPKGNSTPPPTPGPEETSAPPPTPGPEETSAPPPTPGPEETSAPPPDAPAGILAAYEVQWRFEGFADEPLEAGDRVEATPEDAAPFVACGVLKPVQETA
jgi:hypothetical protein